MWPRIKFEQDVSLNWHRLAQTKPGNYWKKLRAIYRAEKHIDALPLDFVIPLHEEIAVNTAYGWAFYNIGSRNDTGALVLGPETIRQRQHILSSFGISAVKPYKNTLTARNKSENVEHADENSGGVLSETNWWPFLNDAWVLGGVHTLIRFYLHTPRSYDDWLKDDTIWDSANGRPRALGRELIAIHACGYRRVVHDHERLVGLTFAPTELKTAMEATFRTICDAVENFHSAQDIKNLVEEGVLYDSYNYQTTPYRPLAYKVLSPITAYEQSMPGSFTVVYEIQPGDILVDQEIRGDYYRVQTQQLTVTKHATGHPTETYVGATMVLLVHKDLLRPTSMVVERA